LGGEEEVRYYFNLKPEPSDLSGSEFRDPLIEEYYSAPLNPSIPPLPDVHPEENNTIPVAEPEFARESVARSGSSSSDRNDYRPGGCSPTTIIPGEHSDQLGPRNEYRKREKRKKKEVYWTAECLLLEKTAQQTEETYERVGRLIFNSHCFDRETWETKTFKLV
jgi:hypothetical protein